MSDITTLAEAVAASLSQYQASVQYAPELGVGNVATRQVIVIPYGVSFKPLSLSVREEILTIQVGVVKKADQDDVDDLVDFTQQLALGFLHETLGGATCVDVSFEPVYSASHLREKGMFVSVFSLVFRKTVAV